MPMAKKEVSNSDVVKHIKEVISQTDKPSWLGSVPHNFGSAAAGTLKADEWRTMYSVYLPLALVSLWGEGTNHPFQDRQKWRAKLDHTMALISAIRIACLRTTTVARATAYRSYILQWIDGLGQLYPDLGKRTNHHIAIHISDFLRLFGPVHSWWTFPFERLIGQLQRLHHNHKFGKQLNIT